MLLHNLAFDGSAQMKEGLSVGNFLKFFQYMPIFYRQINRPKAIVHDYIG